MCYGVQTTGPAKGELAKNGWTILHCPPYPSGVASSDCYLFSSTQPSLNGPHFLISNDTEEGSKVFLSRSEQEPSWPTTKLEQVSLARWWYLFQMTRYFCLNVMKNILGSKCPSTDVLTYRLNIVYILFTNQQNPPQANTPLFENKNIFH